MNRLKSLILAGLLCLTAQANGQEVMDKAEALRQLMANNFNVIISEKSIEIAKNNTSIYNSGYLPTLTGNAGITYNIDDLNVQFRDGNSSELKGARSDSRNAGLNLNFVIFNGFNRKYNMSRNMENLNRSQLNARSVLETALIDLFNAYYTVARSQQNLENLEQTLKISKERLTRAEYGFEYGRNSRLDVSNAQVDVNTDSINFLNALQVLENSKRNLNFQLGRREGDTNFSVETGLSFAELGDRDKLREQLKSNNVLLLIAKSDLALSQYDSRIVKSGYLPTLSASTALNYRLGNNNNASFLISNTSTGVTGNVSLGWNLFDGGGTRTAAQNAKVSEEVNTYTLEQLGLQLEVDFDNAWADYANKRFIVQAQESNLTTNEQNFERTQEQYKLGQVSSIDFRTAQRNLLLAQINLINAQYDAKLAELLIFRLSGLIQEADF